MGRAGHRDRRCREAREPGPATTRPSRPDVGSQRHRWHNRGRPLRGIDGRNRGRDGRPRPADGRDTRWSRIGRGGNLHLPHMACEQDHNAEEGALSMANQTDGPGPSADAVEDIIIDSLMGGVLTPRVIKRLAGSGLTAINLTAVRIGATLPEALSDLAVVRETIERNSRQLQLATTAADIRSAKATGRVGIVIGMQDTEPVGRNLSVLRTLRD